MFSLSILSGPPLTHAALSEALMLKPEQTLQNDVLTCDLSYNPRNNVAR